MTINKSSHLKCAVRQKYMAHENYIYINTNWIRKCLQKCLVVLFSCRAYLFEINGKFAQYCFALVIAHQRLRCDIFADDSTGKDFKEKTLSDVTCRSMWRNRWRHIRQYQNRSAWYICRVPCIRFIEQVSMLKTRQISHFLLRLSTHIFKHGAVI